MDWSWSSTRYTLLYIDSSQSVWTEKQDSLTHFVYACTLWMNYWWNHYLSPHCHRHDHWHKCQSKTYPSCPLSCRKNAKTLNLVTHLLKSYLITSEIVCLNLRWRIKTFLLGHNEGAPQVSLLSWCPSQMLVSPLISPCWQKTIQ